MYQINVTNELTGKIYSYRQPDEASKDAMIEKMIKMNHWGQPERYIKTSELTEELQSRVLSTRMVELEVEDPYEESLVKADYVIEVQDLTQDVEFRNQEKIKARKAEYPSIEEVMHIILDKGLDSQEYADMQALRQSIKDKYPKE